MGLPYELDAASEGLHREQRGEVELVGLRRVLADLPPPLLPTYALPDRRRPTHWPRQDFRESFSESCGDLAKGRKSTKVAGGARASGHSIVEYCTSEQKFAFRQAQKRPNSRATTRQEADPHLKNHDFCLEQRRK